jgi:phenylacetate-coenzyme A ligase PaaK-like adenylate-forming protein
LKNIINLNSDSKIEVLKECFKDMDKLTYRLAQTPIQEIIEVLSQVSKAWSKDSSYYQRALDYLENEKSFSSEMNVGTLDLLPTLLDKSNLEKRLQTEFKNIRTLDGPDQLKGYEGKIYYAPLGTVLHVTAGNVFLGAIDSIIMGVLTKNISLVKLSQKNLFVPNLFIESLKAVDVNNVIFPYIKLFSWKGGDKSVEDFFKKRVDGIIAWGGEDMVTSYQNELPSKVKFIQHGPKISFQVISKKFLEKNPNSVHDIVKDIITYDQAACANSQNIYLEETIDYDQFLKQLVSAFENNLSERRELDSNEYVELLKDQQEGSFYEYISGNKRHVGTNFQIQYDHDVLAPSALNRSIKIKKFKNSFNLYQRIKSFSFYLQTCGLGVTAKESIQYKKDLILAGVNRVTDLGQMLSSLDGSPHDGQYSLMELTRVCADETKESMAQFLQLNQAPFYSELKDKELCDYPLIDGDTLAKHSLIKDRVFLEPNANSGFLYSSGGTTGNPKYCFYDYDEFEVVTDLLARSYKELGLAPGMHVANLFMAGNMWSSFNAVQDALKACNTVQYPIGGLVAAEDLKFLVEKFKIKVLFGLPGMLIKLANEVPSLEIDMIFYAGESFSDEGLEYIKKTWNCSKVFSAGYASVDVGPIGYQGADCDKGEHYLFDDLIKLEIINEEAVVTSKIRKKMPIIRYQTGDKVKLIETSNGKTKFKLIGRVDKKINIWSSRFEFSEVKSVLDKIGYSKKFQVILNKKSLEDHYKEILEIHLLEKVDSELLIETMYRELKDVSDTHDKAFLEDKIIPVVSDLLNSSKTGKFKNIIDLRY